MRGKGFEMSIAEIEKTKAELDKIGLLFFRKTLTPHDCYKFVIDHGEILTAAINALERERK